MKYGTYGLSSPFNPSSPQAQSIESLFSGVLALAAFIFILVTMLVALAAWRFRAKTAKGASFPAEPPQRHGNAYLESLWTILPMVAIAGIFVFTVLTMRDADPETTGHEPDLIVTGHQWWWEANYPQAGISTANEIHIPVGRPLVIELRAADVIHDFWVPELGRKMDAIPGRPNRFWLQSDRPGIFLGFCAEFCGLSHAWMQIRVIAQNENDFRAWKAAQHGLASVALTPAAQRGAELFQEKTCVSCHALSGDRAEPDVGPNLAHVGSRHTLAAGVLENDPENMGRWLINPAKYKPGAHMPNMRLSSAEAEALSAYLEELQ